MEFCMGHGSLWLCSGLCFVNSYWFSSESKSEREQANLQARSDANLLSLPRHPP